MFFHSTRGKDKSKSFEEVLMQGLADDGGLFMPDSTTVVDNITYGSQSDDDVAYGRYPDSSATWQFMNPTPGMANTVELSLNNNIVMPDQYIIHQNYPNPFNLVTTLRYDLPEEALVNITIYDMMGRVVNNLVSSQQRAGYKSIQWNATNSTGQPVSAGLYLYTIEAGQFRQTRKMVLLK